MSAITPQTELRLVKCPIESDNRNQMTFSNKTAQYNYFNSLPHLTVDNFTYQRKDNVIRYPAHIDSIITYNYVMYQNEAYTNKWFYAFITNMEYVNDNMTLITIHTDVYQTWQFDMVWKRSYIEREHVNDDTIGANTVPENVMTGDIISCKLQPGFTANTEKCFVLAVSELLSGVSYTSTGQLIPSGLYYIGLTDNSGLKEYIKAYDKAGKTEAISSVFITLKSFFSNWHSAGTVVVDGSTFLIGNYSTNVSFSYTEDVTISKVNYLANEYYPKNNKLLTYPYSYLQISNHNGTIVNYKWEDFNLLLHGNDIKFKLQGTITPGGSFSAYPIDYKNILSNYDENITLGKFPIGGWSSDIYTNWLTQNGVNIAGVKLDATTYRVSRSALQGMAGITQLALGDVTGSMNLAGGITGVFNALQDDYQHSLIPDQAGGNLSIGDYSYQFGLTNLEYKRMSIKEEYAKIIDDWFTMYGYKVNRVKLPNITGRTNWNYVKTIGANIEGDIPEDHLNEIKTMFNNGVTLWHNTNTYLDYSQSNAIA